MSYRSEMVPMGDSKSGSFINGDISYQINATDTDSPLNGKPHIGVTITFSDSVDKPDGYNFDLLVSGNGHFDSWWYPDKPATVVNFTSISGDRGGLNYIPGDRIMNVAIPSTAKNVISAAAYTTRSRWDHDAGCCQVSYKVDDILGFSSSGPSADPAVTGQKPEIAAPGAMIASTKSRDTKVDDLLLMPDGQHMLMAGTSMASPFVTGTIALMFSANPNYTYMDVERYLTDGAYVDSFVGTVPNDRWGYGKLDVLKAIEKALGGGASASLSSNPELTLPGGVQSKPSCQLLTTIPGSQANAVVLLIWIVLTITPFIIVKSRALN